MSDVKTPPIKSPNEGTYHLVRNLLGFMVWVAIGCAPILGKLRIPLFSPLIDMYPFTLRDWLIPLSGLMMGMIAVIVDFATVHGSIARERIRLAFIVTASIFGAAFILLVVLYQFLVVRVEATVANGERSSIAVVTGALVVPAHPPGSKCGCPPGETAELCIGSVSLDPAVVRDCFGSQRVVLAGLALALIYLVLTGGFAAAVGLGLLLRRRRTRVV